VKKIITRIISFISFVLITIEAFNKIILYLANKNSKVTPIVDKTYTWRFPDGTRCYDTYHTSLPAPLCVRSNHLSPARYALLRLSCFRPSGCKDEWHLPRYKWA